MLYLLYSEAINNEITREGKARVSLALDLELRKSANIDTESVIKHLEGIFDSLTFGQLRIVGKGLQTQIVYFIVHLLNLAILVTAYHLP